MNVSRAITRRMVHAKQFLFFAWTITGEPEPVPPASILISFKMVAAYTQHSLIKIAFTIQTLIAIHVPVDTMWKTSYVVKSMKTVYHSIMRRKDAMPAEGG